MTVFIVVHSQITIDCFLAGVSNLAVDQQHFVVNLYAAYKLMPWPLSGSQHTTELSNIEVIFGAKADVGIGTRIVPLEPDGDNV